MSDFDVQEHLAAQARHHGPIGCVEKAVSMHPDLRDYIIDAVASEYPARVVERTLKDRGVHLSDYTVLRHRRRSCRCIL